MFEVLELSGLFVCMGGLVFQCLAWTEEIAGLWFAGGGISTQADSMVTTD